MSLADVGMDLIQLDNPKVAKAVDEFMEEHHGSGGWNMLDPGVVDLTFTLKTEYHKKVQALRNMRKAGLL